MLNGKSPECATEVVMEEGIPSFQLHFSTLDFIEPRKVRYAYRIKGQLSGWNHTTNNQIEFSMLTPGRYELQVKACNSEYMWSPNIKTITIRILPPWYKTWWAYLSYLLITTLAGWRSIAYFYSRRKQRATLKVIEQKTNANKRLRT